MIIRPHTAVASDLAVHSPAIRCFGAHNFRLSKHRLTDPIKMDAELLDQCRSILEVWTAIACI